MSKFLKYIEESRNKNWGSQSDSLTLEQINLGCMLRVADSLETIAKDKADLEMEVKKQKDNYDYMRSRRDYLQEVNASLTKGRNAYKGLYLKIKAELQQLKANANQT